MVSTLTTTIQHSFGSLSHSNQRRKRNKGIQIRKEEAKLSVFANDMMLYIDQGIVWTPGMLPEA